LLAFCFDKADILNKSISEKVMGWQRLGGLPESHTWALLETAKKVLKGLMADGKDKEAEIQTVVEQKESSQSSCSENGNQSSPEGTQESDHDSDSSGILIEEDECATLPKEPNTPATKACIGEPEISPPEVRTDDSTS
jgi:hypothetical protein